MEDFKPQKDVIRVLSYNILSDAYSTVETYPTCSPFDLDGSTRLERIQQRLNIEIASSLPIICLQEVSLNYASQLLPYFEKQNYTFIHSSYDPNGHLGVALAFPRKKYTLAQLSIKRIVDTCDWPTGITTTEPFDTWTEAKNRKNVVILARLQSSTSTARFCIATYHMPCAYGSDQRMQLMNIHASLVFQYTQQWSSSDPLVVAGDFNFYPVDSTYQLVHSGELSHGHPQKASPSPVIWGNPSGKFSPMRSAYKACGGELGFTSISFSEKGGRRTEILDYIFVSDSWEVQNVLRPNLSDLYSNIKSLPTQSEPSDHLCIGADLLIWCWIKQL